MIELDYLESNGAKIRVIGVGGCGGNAINNMIEKGLGGVQFISANTDRQVLDKNLAQVKLQIGVKITNGLGAGGKPEVGEASADESHEEISKSLEGSDMVFIAAGMGGGTGTGAAPVIARIASENDTLVVAVVTKPFQWEGKRTKVANKGIEDLRQHVDALITIPNQKLLDITDKKATFKQAYMNADEVLFNATRGISDIITKPGLVNVDFADVKSIMKGMGDALMGIGVATGESRAAEATHNALNSPLLDNISINGSQGVLVNITGSEDLTTLHEVAEIVSIIEDEAGADVNLIHGVVLVEDTMEELMVTVVATGFNSNEDLQKSQRPTMNFKNKEMEMFKGRKTQTHSKEKNGIRNAIPESKTEVAKSSHTTPKGPSELRELDVPAYVRRMGTIPDDINVSDTQIKTEKEKVIAGVDIEKMNSIKNYDPPAFLRKIMD